MDRPLTTRQRCVLAFRTLRRRIEPQNAEEWAGWYFDRGSRYQIPDRIPYYIRQEALYLIEKVRREACQGVIR
jgi:hypothetical protein